jgi:LacI family transcriptional regulator
LQNANNAAMGSHRPRLKEVAQRAGVSVATVSRALSRPDLVNSATLGLVQQTAAALGYIPVGPARALVSGRSRIVGAIVPTLDHAIFARAIQAMQTSLDAAGYQLLVASHEYSPASETAAIRAMLSRGVDALMVVGADRLDEAWGLLTSAQIPVVLTWSLDERLACIGFDNELAGRLAAEHLLSLGHRAFGMISGTRRSNDRARLRIDGIRAALRPHGCDLPEWRVSEQAFTFAGGRAGLAELLATAEPPTAVIGGNDLLAAGALIEAQARGLRVPRDLSVVGIDNLDISLQVTPALTTVHLPTATLGEEAALHLLARLQGRDKPSRTVLPIELIVRGSTCEPIRGGVEPRAALSPVAARR